MRRSFLTIAIAVLACASTIRAHESRPGYLEIRQTGEATYDVLWKVPARGEMRLGIYATLPEDCEATGPPRVTQDGWAFIEESTVRCGEGLTGKTIAIEGLSGTLTDALARVERQDGTTQIARLTPAAPSFVVEATPSGVQVAKSYLRLGVEHIFLGFDHLLFVACLMFVAGTVRRVLITITGFTLAHSLTLALSALELVRVPVPPVEAAIALSIVFLAFEIARNREDSLTFRFPIAVSTSFGLLHGFGFAAVLREIGLPQTDLPIALLFFNVGVEVGQVLFVAALALILLVFARAAAPGTTLARVRMPACYAIGALASYWLITRVAGFWA